VLDGSARFALLSPMFGDPRRKRVVSIPRDETGTMGGGTGGGGEKGATGRAKRAA